MGFYNLEDEETKNNKGGYLNTDNYNFRINTIITGLTALVILGGYSIFDGKTSNYQTDSFRKVIESKFKNRKDTISTEINNSKLYNFKLREYTPEQRSLFRKQISNIFLNPKVENKLENRLSSK